MPTHHPKPTHRAPRPPLRHQPSRHQPTTLTCPPHHFRCRTTAISGLSYAKMLVEQGKLVAESLQTLTTCPSSNYPSSNRLSSRIRIASSLAVLGCRRTSLSRPALLRPSDRKTYPCRPECRRSYCLIPA